MSKPWIKFIKRQWAILKWEVDFFFGQLALRKFAKNYVPKYGLRTPEEHAKIRERLKRNPSACLHLKGSANFGINRIHKDYNVSMHTFVDGSSRVRCNSCGKRWFKNKAGWKDALEMVRQSTNKPSASEIFPKGKK